MFLGKNDLANRSATVSGGIEDEWSPCGKGILPDAYWRQCTPRHHVGRRGNPPIFNGVQP